MTLKLFGLGTAMWMAVGWGEMGAQPYPVGADGLSPERFKTYRKKSYYLTAEDGVKLAVDEYLPKGLPAGEKIPSILFLTRYVRSLEPIGLFKPLVKSIPTNVRIKEVEDLIRRGYAVYVVDVRGSGASFSTKMMEFSPEEMRDGKTILEHLSTRPHSNGRVGATGVSYVGTTALMAMYSGHPALRAVAPRSAIWDLYADLTHPGGIRLGGFIEVWGRVTQSLDRNDFRMFGFKAKRLIKGISPVDDDRDRKLLAQAVAQHERNFDIISQSKFCTFRDDQALTYCVNVDQSSPHYYRSALEASKTPVFWISGWYDAGLAHSAIKGYASLSNSVRLLIGPWDHGPKEFISPHNPKPRDRAVRYPLQKELVRFWDFYLKDIPNGFDQEPPVKFYTLGEEKWYKSPTWPPPGFSFRRFYLEPGFKLQADAPSKHRDCDGYVIDYLASTGGGSRWNSLTDKYRYAPIGYPDRKEQDLRLLVYESAPLERDYTLTGHPRVQLQVASATDDVHVFVYLEEVMADGRVIYVTEGQLRAVHRKLSDAPPPYVTFGPYRTFRSEDARPLVPGVPEEMKFDLLPASYKFSKGSKIRLAIAGADHEHFDAPASRPEYLKVCRPSFVELPLK
jgi:putative CocE/NonD family hydrolase